MSRESRIVVNAIVVLFVAGAAAQASSVTWTGAGDGSSWTDGANWSSTPNPPAAGDAAYFNSPTVVDIATSATIAQLNTTGSGTLTVNSGTLNATSVGFGTSVNLPNGLIIGPGATLISPGADRSQFQVLTVNGTLDLNNNGSGWGYLAGSGTVTNSPSNSQQQFVLDLGGNKTSTFSGSITGKLYLDVRGGATSGTGRQVLTGASSYSGITLIADFGAVSPGLPNAELQLAGGNNRLPTTTALFFGNNLGIAKGQLILGDSSGASNQSVTGIFSFANDGSAVSIVGGNAGVSSLSVGDSQVWDYHGVLGGSGTNENNLALTKTGTGTLNLYGINTYAGNTTATAGTLHLIDNAGLRFVIGANGVNNEITGASTGTVTLDGDFTFDLSGAVATSGNSWQIVDLASLNPSSAFGASFTVNGFTENSNVWTQVIGNSSYQFSEATGVLTVLTLPEPASLSVMMLGGLMLGRRRRGK